MTVLTNRDAIRIPSPRGLIIRRAKPSETYYGGWLVGRRRGSRVCEIPTSTTPHADMIIEGVCEFIQSPPFTASATADSGGGAIDSVTQQQQNIRIVGAPTGWFDTAASGVNKITEDMLGLPAYAYDNNTLYATDGGGIYPRAGTIDRVDPRGKVSLVFDATADDLAGGDLDNEPTVRAVVTSLGAYTASAGTITVTATGALGTQDGITVAAGDEVWLPEYTGTANASVNVAAADSGPYEIVTLGATGVSAVLRRPAWWAHGAPMPLGAAVKIAEGTLFGRTVWDVGAAKGSTIGTTDPAAYPRSVTRQVVLVAGHLAVTNIPIRHATGGSNFLTSRLTANTSTLTVGGYHPLSISAGPLGTATVDITACVAAGTINVADVSTLILTITN